MMFGLTHRLLQDKLYRDYLMIFANSYFGLRISDLLSLRYSDVMDRSELILVEQKTNKQRKININPKVAIALKRCAGILEQQGKYRPDVYIYANRWGGHIGVSYVNKRLKYIFKKYGVAVQNPSSHTIRKTFGKRVWEADSQSDRALVYLSEIFSLVIVTIESPNADEPQPTEIQIDDSGYKVIKGLTKAEKLAAAAMIAKTSASSGNWSNG